MKQYMWVEVREPDYSRVLLKLFKARIEVYETKYCQDSLQLKILASDFGKLKKVGYYRCRKVRFDGIFHLKELFRRQWLIVVGLFLFPILLFVFSHIIVDVQVIHSNKEIRELVEKALSDYGIERLTFRKDFREIEHIKKELLNRFPEQLEWLEIEVDGMRYIVRIEERIITHKEEKKERCHLVATKSAIVKQVTYSIGEAKVARDDYVVEGDILISGELMANEAVVSSVCATGKVLGEVWYTTHVSLPMNYEKKQETGKKRWNFMISKGSYEQTILRPRLEHYVNEKKRLFSIFGYEFYFVVQKEVVVTEETYLEEEALKESIRLADEKMQMRLQDGEQILDKKVLKKNVNNSTMDIEVFVSVLENISRQEEFQEQKEEG